MPGIFVLWPGFKNEKCEMKKRNEEGNTNIEHRMSNVQC
jgi:hypothetical protein